jgi:hypothetical protein
MKVPDVAVDAAEPEESQKVRVQPVDERPATIGSEPRQDREQQKERRGVEEERAELEARADGDMQLRRKPHLSCEQLVDERVEHQGLDKAVRSHSISPVPIVDHVERPLVRQESQADDEDEDEPGHDYAVRAPHEPDVAQRGAHCRGHRTSRLIAAAARSPA